MSFFRQKAGTINLNPTKETKANQERFRKVFKTFLQSIDGEKHNYFKYGNHMIPMAYNVFIKLDTNEKVKYDAVFMSTMGRDIGSIRGIHYMDLAVDNPKATFDFAHAQLDRKSLISSRSMETNAKTFLGGQNQDEMGWVLGYKDDHGQYPLSRPKGPEFIITMSTGQCVPIASVLKRVKDFLDVWYLKPKNKIHVRGAQNHGLTVKEFSRVFMNCWNYYNNRLIYHTPKYLVGCGLLHLVPNFVQRSEKETLLLKYGKDVIKSAHCIQFSHPAGIKNNKSSKSRNSSGSQMGKKAIVTIHNIPEFPPNSYDVFDTIIKQRPSQVKDCCLWAQPLSSYADMDADGNPCSMFDNIGGYVVGSKLGEKGAMTCIKMCMKSCNIEYTGTFNDMRYLSIDIMRKLKFQEFQIIARSGHSKHGVEDYFEMIESWEEFKDTEQIIHAGLTHICNDTIPDYGYLHSTFIETHKNRQNNNNLSMQHFRKLRECKNNNINNINNINPWPPSLQNNNINNIN
eukprot:320952_1